MKCSRLFSQIRIVGVSALLALSVSACMKPGARAPDPNADFSSDKAGANQAAATFYTDEVTGGAIVSKNMDGFSIASEKLFNFKVCVKDKRTQESIKGHKFNILGASSAVTVANNGRSDETGCVNWSEKIAFNGAADAKFIPLKRTVVADGMHKGARDLQICINPWDTSDTVRDCGRRPVPESQLVKAKDVVQALNGESALGEKIERHLWVDDLRINSAHNPGGADGALLDFSVSMGPKVLTKNIRGETSSLVLTDGEFSVQFWVVAKTGGADAGKCLVIAKSDPSGEMTMVGGRLQDELNMKVRYLSTYGQLELVGVVAPKSEGIKIGSYNGVWIMGDHASLLGMKFGFPRPAAYKGEVGTFSAKKYVEDCIDVSGGTRLEKPKTTPVVIVAAATAAGKSPVGGASGSVTGAGKYAIASAGQMPIAKFMEERSSLKAQIPADLNVYECVRPEDIPRLFPLDDIAQKFQPGDDVLSCANDSLPSGVTKVEQFEFENVAVRAEPIANPIDGETTTERTVKYVVTTTVRNPMAQGAPLRDIIFNVTKSDGTVEPIRTNAQGVLIFNDEIKHVYFHPERYMLKVVQISHASGFKKRLPIVFNPWDNNGFTFGRDIRLLKKQIIAQVNLIPRPKSELLLTQFQWGTQGFRYEVDNFLNLKMFKQFNLTINPRVLRYSSLTEGRMKNEALRDGVYLMKVAIQKDYKPVNEPKPLEFVTAIKKLVRVANGIINTPVEMDFQDFRVLKIRSNMMIEIQTIDEAKLSQKQRKELTFDGPIESLIEPNSGLAARTFVGPVVAYSNGFSASMRPTDDLAESICATIDCDEIKKEELKKVHKELADLATSSKQAATDASRDNEKKVAGGLKATADAIAQQVKSRDAFERAQAAETVLAATNAKEKSRIAEEKKKYRGSIEHLAHKTVGDMIEKRAVINAANELKYKQAANLTTILKLGNFEFGSLNNEALIASREKAVSINNLALPNGQAFSTLVQKLATEKAEGRLVNNQFVQVFKQLAPKALDMNDLRKTLFENGALTNDQAARLCFFFVEDLMLRRNEKSEASMSYLDQVKASYTRRNVNELCLRAVFASTAKNAPGLSSVFSVEHMMRVSKVTDSDPLGGTLMKMGISSGASFDHGSSESTSYGWSPIAWIKEIPVVGKFVDASGVSVSMSRSQSKGVSEGGSIGSDTGLAVEMRGMRLEVAEHERCTAIRFSDRFFQQNIAYVNQAFPKSMSDEDKQSRMTRGILLCEGIARKNPTIVDERYYQFSQSIGEEALNDVGDILNHPYLLTVRGRTDYVRFANILKAQPRETSAIPMHIQIEEYPIERLMKAFSQPSPVFPGVLRLDDDSIRQIAHPAK
ncbi:hypothetical protein BH10BDE1_BH10BDE1_29050 [soil metagenome]